LHAAIGPSNESIRLYKVRDDAVGVPYWASQLASTKREVIAGHADRIPGLDELIVAEDVPCRTLASIVREFGLPRLDLLVSDTEGYDFEVIKQIDQLPHRPQFIHFESLHLPPSDFQSCLAFLHARDYETHDIQPGETFAELRALA
jgi:FkbM family methyltransferase